MIKKLLATTLATLSVASMSLPAMAVGGEQSSKQQTTSHSKNKSMSLPAMPVGDKQSSKQQTTSHSKNKSEKETFDSEITKKDPIKQNEKSKKKNKNKSEKETFGFVHIENPRKNITDYDTGVLPLYKTKKVRADKATPNSKEDFTFEEITVSEEQREAIDKEIDRRKCEEDGNKAAGYLAIETNLLSLKTNVVNTQEALKRFDVITASSEVWNAAKNVAYIAGDVVSHPISGGLRYAYDHKLLTAAKKKVVDYAKNDLKSKVLDYAGLNEEYNEKDNKIAKVFKWGKKIFNFFAGEEKKEEKVKKG